MATAGLQTPVATVAAPELSAEAPAPNVDTTPVLPEGVPYLLSAEDFFRMVDAEIIPEERRVGLWEGRLYEKMGKNIPHATVQAMILSTLIRIMPDGWFSYSECPILVNDRTAPLPDMVIVRGDPMVYYRRRSVPQVGEIGLVIEIADSSLKKNLTESLQTYARAGLPVYWVVNLVENRLEVYSEPNIGDDNAAAYGRRETFGPGMEIPLILDGREAARVPASQLLLEGTN